MHKHLMRLCFKYFEEYYDRYFKKYFKQIITIVALLGVFVFGLSKYFEYGTKSQYLYFEGPNDAGAMLYKIKKNRSNRTEFIAIQKLTTHSKTLLPLGSYFIANECSAYKFNLIENQPTQITLNLLKVQYFDTNQNQYRMLSDGRNVEIQCSDKVTGERFDYTDKNEFYILPGKNLITIAGMNLLLDATEAETKNFIVRLVPLKLVSAIPNDKTQYFIQPARTDPVKSAPINPLHAAQVNNTIWLNPGKYEVEINGTTSIISIQEQRPTVIKLGTLRIAQPKNFLGNDRTKFIRQPVFAYLNKKILLSLDKDYAIFPGHYSINLDNSEMIKKIDVLEDSYIRIQTFGAQINPPACSEEMNQNCTFSQKAFIYAKQQRYVLHKVALGTPFLVFQDEYQYSIEGADGIIKNLPIFYDSIKPDQVGRLKLNWKWQVSTTNSETRKIYIEPTCCGLYGKTDDLNSYKPREILVPEGEYLINYFVKYEKNILKKNTIGVHIGGETQNEALIPIYTNATQVNNILIENTEVKTQEPSTLTPLAQ